MIWLLDLDNTLVDRAAAFGAWASDAVAQVGGTADDLAAIVAADEGGHGSKEALARVIVDRLGWPDDVPAAIERFRAGILAGIRPYDGVLRSLEVLRAAGHRVAVVTNGASAQQRGKIARCGIEPHVDAIVVSGEEGVAKPDPRLVEVALDRLGASDVDRRDVWMIGDAAHADVAVGRAAGTRTGWVSHGRAWQGGDRPDVVAPATREVIALAASPRSRGAVG
ncbi:HAD family hydrolase [Isoptericola sp. NEAU-Y5]|uniref:HAD family hydrolase n=1 Tax=Isoptericola luteus TaxID=2879484 RepID=A0ABS7ZI09_9MICO|nr:HAD family hydrolase [Isoptericola sp. NEAU-Y5]MCA5893931.1 HAD family hydrolase [Isoptericola sp. NEAU-Y5]